MKKVFKEEGAFQSLYKAEKWLTDNGFNYGSTCVQSNLVALYKGEYIGSAWKWRGLSMKERRECHGIMKSYNYREGEVIIEIKDEYWESK